MPQTHVPLWERCCPGTGARLGPCTTHCDDLGRRCPLPRRGPLTAVPVYRNSKLDRPSPRPQNTSWRSLRGPGFCKHYEISVQVHQILSRYLQFGIVASLFHMCQRGGRMELPSPTQVPEPRVTDDEPALLTLTGYIWCNRTFSPELRVYVTVDVIPNRPGVANKCHSYLLCRPQWPHQQPHGAQHRLRILFSPGSKADSSRQWVASC